MEFDITDLELTPRYYIQVSGSKMIDTGIQEKFTSRSRGRVSTHFSHYYALKVGDKFLLVKKDGAFEHEPGPPFLVKGLLDTIPAHVHRSLPGKPNMQADRMDFYPFFLFTDVDRIEKTLLYTMILVFGWFLFWKAIPAWRQFWNPASQPVAARVRSWGDSIALSSEIEQECRAPRLQRRGLIAGWTFTDHYIIFLSKLFAFDVHRFKDLLWVRAPKHLRRSISATLPTEFGHPFRSISATP